MKDMDLSTFGKLVMIEYGQQLPPRGAVDGDRQDLRSQLRNAEAKLEQQDAMLRSILEAAMPVGTILSVEPDGKKCTVLVGGQRVSCNRPGFAVPGQQVRVHPKTMQPVDCLAENISSGEVVTVKAVHGDVLEVSGGPGTRAVARGRVTAEPGDRVVVDQSYQIAIMGLGPEEETFLFTDATSVSWDDIGGLDDAKEALREALEFPLTHADLYRNYGEAPSRGVLLYGPPGCGKTMLGKAAATAAAGRSAAPGGFIYVKGPEVLSKWVGESEQTVRALFRQARDFKKRTGQPAVLFIDEAEALLSSRETDGFRGGVQQTLVPAFLAEMDGLEDSGAFVILSTNAPDSLDSAITRDGRIDRKVEVRRPDRHQALRIFELALKGRPVRSEVNERVVCDAVFGHDEPIAVAVSSGFSVELRLSDCMSGALAAGIVNRATKEAMRRDRLAGLSEPSGIATADIEAAVAMAAKEMRHLDWRKELRCKFRSAGGGGETKASAEMN